MSKIITQGFPPSDPSSTLLDLHIMGKQRLNLIIISSILFFPLHFLFFFLKQQFPREFLLLKCFHVLSRLHLLLSGASRPWQCRDLPRRSKLYWQWDRWVIAILSVQFFSFLSAACETAPGEMSGTLFYMQVIHLSLAMASTILVTLYKLYRLSKITAV